MIGIQKMKSFDEIASDYQRRAIESDLSDLLKSTSTPRSRSNDNLDVMGRALRISPPIWSNQGDQWGQRPFRNLSEMAGPVPRTPHKANTVCQVQFKHIHRNYMIPDSLLGLQIGEFVIVQSFVDKSLEDMGVVTALYTSERFTKMRQLMAPSDDIEETKVGKILRLATREDRILLPLKAEKEVPILRACQGYAEAMKLDLTIYEAEYQFDGRVLFIYYKSQERVDYREFVQCVIRMCCPKTRVQMKKTNASLNFVAKPFAKCALLTGDYYLP